MRDFYFKFIDYCRNGSLLCRNNATCINRPDLADFACNCTNPYYGRLCEYCKSKFINDFDVYIFEFDFFLFRWSFIETLSG